MYNNEMLLEAATWRAAEFEVSRSYPIRLTGEHIVRMLIAANGQNTGYWQGGRLGITIFFIKLRRPTELPLPAPSCFTRAEALIL